MQMKRQTDRPENMTGWPFCFGEGKPMWIRHLCKKRTIGENAWAKCISTNGISHAFRQLFDSYSTQLIVYLPVPNHRVYSSYCKTWLYRNSKHRELLALELLINWTTPKPSINEWQQWVQCVAVFYCSYLAPILRYRSCQSVFFHHLAFISRSVCLSFTAVSFWAWADVQVGIHCFVPNSHSW